MSLKKFLISGGCGFIGSTVIKHILETTNFEVCNVDKLTYASNLKSLDSIILKKNYTFIKADICNYNKIKKIIFDFKPHIIMNLAAETHVDTSIIKPKKFLDTNIMGTYNLLQISLEYFRSLEKKQKIGFRFHHVSTDEVFGDINNKRTSAKENDSYDPSSPYSASKASSNHLVNVWHKTYNLPIVITNCTNNYGPYQFPEKLIPCIIINAINEKKIPIYGDGLQSRDWLFVDDHVRALLKVALSGNIGETYNIAGKNEYQNIKVAEIICDILDNSLKKKSNKIKTHKELITSVNDRPAHDRKYSLNTDKIKSQLHWHPLESFETGIEKTVTWYIRNQNWWKNLI